MAVLDTTPRLVDVEFIRSQHSYGNQTQLDQELQLGDYNGNVVYALGRSALRNKHWLSIVRIGGFHLIFADAQKLTGHYDEAISKQLALADELMKYNPGFVQTLDNDIEQTLQLMPSGYLLGSVVDYILLSCQDVQTQKRLPLNPDDEHVDASIRAHTLHVVETVAAIY